MTEKEFELEKLIWQLTTENKDLKVGLIVLAAFIGLILFAILMYITWKYEISSK